MRIYDSNEYAIILINFIIYWTKRTLGCIINKN